MEFGKLLPGKLWYLEGNYALPNEEEIRHVKLDPFSRKFGFASHKINNFTNPDSLIAII